MSTVSISVEFAAKGGSRTVNLDNLSTSTTIGEVKNQLGVAANSRFGRQNQFESWDNRRTLADYFVANGEKFDCVIQCMIQEGQPDCDNYEEWLAAHRQNH